MLETLGYIALAWLTNISLNAAIKEEPRPICYVEESINYKTTYVPRFCDSLNSNQEEVIR